MSQAKRKHRGKGGGCHGCGAPALRYCSRCEVARVARRWNNRPPHHRGRWTPVVAPRDVFVMMLEANRQLIVARRGHDFVRIMHNAPPLEVVIHPPTTTPQPPPVISWNPQRISEGI